MAGERATTDPKVFEKLHFTFIVTGTNLTEKAVERAVNLSHDKYCSATAMLGKTADITKSIEIREA